MARRFSSFEEFWPFYISQHMRKATRAFHFAGTTAGLACLAALLLTGRPWWLAAGLLLSYGAAWTSHAFIERNAPATFTYPVLSFRADFRLYRLMLLGRMEREIIRRKAELAPYLRA